MKYASKQQLIRDIEEQFSALQGCLERIPRTRYAEPGVWGEDWTVNDLVAHLTAWHRLLLGWYRDGFEGRVPEMPAPGYKWNETPRLNREIQLKHKDRLSDELWEELEASHAEVMELARELSSDELLMPGMFAWTGKNALVTYLGANTASHYRFACKVLKRWVKPRDAMGAPILFFDIAGTDTAALRRFYNQVFGWQIGEAGTFTVPVTSPLQGAVREDPVEKRIYVGVEDVSATLADVVRSGGSIDQARFEVPGVAVLGLFRDPAGNPMGLIELESGSPKVP